MNRCRGVVHLYCDRDGPDRTKEEFFSDRNGSGKEIQCQYPEKKADKPSGMLSHRTNPFIMYKILG